jgi:2-polyprenyl-3-methyl-5-hydroxy-6-metoxy-1,4-benzoquinol methylase
MFDSGWDLKWFAERAIGREDTFRYVSQICRERDCRTVLDVGGGIGVLNPFLSMGINHTVVDISPRAQNLGKGIFRSVRFITGVIDDITDTYDAVVGLSLIEHLKSYEPFLASAWEKTNKVICISFRNGLDANERISLQSNEYWNNKFSAPKLLTWIRDNLQPDLGVLKEIKVDRDYSP